VCVRFLVPGFEFGGRAGEALSALKAGGEPVPPTLEIFPHKPAPVVFVDSGAFTAQYMLFGYSAQFAGKAKPTWLPNARSETAFTLPTWRDSLAQRRCLVPAVGFYERSRQKTERLFAAKNEVVFFLAAVYKDFPSLAAKPGGAKFPKMTLFDSPANRSADRLAAQNQRRFAILTKSADEVVGQVHDRMPVVISENSLDDWFFGDFEGCFHRSNVELVSKVET
jgi:putative SOS response-associated peptidase YedK